MQMIKSEKMHRSGHNMIKILTVVCSTMAAMLGYFLVNWGGKIDSAAVGVEVLNSNMGIYHNEIQGLKSDVKLVAHEQYTKSQAVADRRLIDLEFNIIHKRIDGIENK